MYFLLLGVKSCHDFFNSKEAYDEQICHRVSRLN